VTAEPLPLTGERTVPGIPEENYWFRRHEAAYLALARHCVGATVLEAGMTFTDEPSIIVPGAYGVRIEDIVVCEEGGGRYLEEYPKELVANR